MDTLGPRVMVNVGTQAVSTTGLNPLDLAPLTNDAFLATFLGKPVLPTTIGLSRQQNNYRQSYPAQTERGTLRSKTRPSTSNGGDSMEPDSAILSIIRGNGTENQPQVSQHRSARPRYHSFVRSSQHHNDHPKAIVIVVVRGINNNYLAMVITIYLVHLIIDRTMISVADDEHVEVVRSNKALR